MNFPPSSASCLTPLTPTPSCAELARYGGYDGVEVMGSEGYLINQFIVKRTNKRTDKWGTLRCRPWDCVKRQRTRGERRPQFRA